MRLCLDDDNQVYDVLFVIAFGIRLQYALFRRRRVQVRCSASRFCVCFCCRTDIVCCCVCSLFSTVAWLFYVPAGVTLYQPLRLIGIRLRVDVFGAVWLWKELLLITTMVSVLFLYLSIRVAHQTFC